MVTLLMGFCAGVALGLAVEAWGKRRIADAVYWSLIAVAALGLEFLSR